MANVRDIREIVDFIKSASDGWEKAKAKAMVATMTHAELKAKQNATKQFIGRNDRRLSGTLLNSIYSTVVRDAKGQAVGELGVKDIPYGAIHEFGSKDLPGGVIKPTKAQKLWLPKYRTAGRMTPREFMRLRKANPQRFFLNDKVAGTWVDPKARVKRLIPLFFLVDQVRIPERPYLRPAMEAAMDMYPGFLSQFYAEEFD